MKNKKIWIFYIGIAWFAFLLLAYFIPIYENGANYVVEDSLLGKIIFHNLIILAIYVIIGVALIVFGRYNIEIL